MAWNRFLICTLGAKGPGKRMVTCQGYRIESCWHPFQMSSGTPSRYGIHMWYGFIICEYMWYMFIWYRLCSPYIFQNLISDFLLKQRDSRGAFWSISLTFALRCLTTWSPTLKVSRQVQATTASPDHTRPHWKSSFGSRKALPCLRFVSMQVSELFYFTKIPCGI